jgi:hypothetical protein
LNGSANARRFALSVASAMHGKPIPSVAQAAEQSLADMVLGPDGGNRNTCLT